MDLALNNLQRLICHKTQTTNQPIFSKVKELSQPYYLTIAKMKIVGFIPFPKILELCELQTASSRFELYSISPFPMTITITQVPPFC